MKIEIRKISLEPKKFNLNLKDIDFDININGSICKLINGLIKIESNLIGKINVICDISGDEYTQNIDRALTLFANNGIWKNNDVDDYCDVIEFFDSFINLDSIFISEIESIKLEYHIK
ncbi:hypothetical protein [Helicobacter sp. MIT 14-3879]|uniref:hypothetical protein n=1 Tax=Helicobacter sp. MIT 14-3879 TaxID=2040649 RepID=UPI000E1F12B7|nr:hypothetical protein [Helicobacter sp. MIT 14-3879]RDU65655.1 hypothetical protein CQA44_01350 [Helicobacter sp. MIT 14-3879]